jgi:hypothetical protein
MMSKRTRYYIPGRLKCCVQYFEESNILVKVRGMDDVAESECFVDVKKLEVYE